jgi:hypothetical protein
LQRRRLAATRLGDVEVALELDRGEVVDGQVAGLEVGVQLEPDFARFDQRRGTGGGGEGSRREEDQEQR